MNTIQTTQIAFFQHRAARGKNVSLPWVLDGIKGNAWAGQIKRLRSTRKDAPGFEKLKARLPAFMVSATTNGGNKDADVREHSGLLQIDIDGVPVENVADLRDRIGDDRHMIAAFVSPSGNGVKAIMRIPAEVDRHKLAFEAAADYMRETYAVEIDPACSNVNRLCYVTHDPQIVVNLDAVPLPVSSPSLPAERGGGGDSSKSLNPTYYVLHNTLLQDFPDLRPHYQRRVTRLYGKPQRGQRNAAMVDIVASCFCIVAPQFVIAFAEEYYHQHADVFADYDFRTYQREVRAVLAGCEQSYPGRLTVAERNAYTALADETQRAAFRIAHSLSKCETDASVPPPLFHLSCNGLGTRLGMMQPQAARILHAFEKSGIIRTERKGTRREKGQSGVATVFCWML